MHNGFPEGSLFLGMNYWSAADAINMWENWDEAGMERDLKKLADSGITVLRIFPLWSVFQPLTAMRTNFGVSEYRFGEAALPDTEAASAGVSEEACKKLERFCVLAEKHGLQLIVALFTGHMSGRYYAPPAFEGRNLLSDPTLIKWEVRFAKYLVQRFSDRAVIIAWDLGNECNGFADSSVHPDTAYLWTWAIASAIRSGDRTRPILSGFDKIPISGGAFNIRDIGEIVDMNTVHPYNIFHTASDPLPSMRSVLDGVFHCRLYSDLSGKPSLIEEVGAIGYLNCSEKTEADFYRLLAFSAWAHHCGGIMWWCAFDQGTHQYVPYDLNNIGSDYGFFRADGSKKPVAEENARFRAFLRTFPDAALPAHITDAVCIIGRVTENTDMLRTAYCLAKKAGIDLSFAHADDKIPDSDLYILPSVDDNKTISRRRLSEILEKVRRGASLYLSVGEGLFRMIPELTGVTFSYKKRSTGAEAVSIDGKTLYLTADYLYVPERCEAETLATAEDGRAVYFRHRFGEGYLYFSTIPIEKDLAGRADPFSDDAPYYAAWYAPLKRRAAGKKVLSVAAGTVCATEHIIDASNRYAVLINYTSKPTAAVLSLQAGWRISEVFRGTAEQLTVSVEASDAAVIKLSKEMELHDL